MEQLRKQNATQAVGTATDLATARSNILGRIIGTAGTVQQARDTRAAGGVSLAQSMMPAAGLSGADMVNLDMARINQQNKIQQGLGEANAAKATAQGQMYSGIIGGVASGVTAGMGGGGGGYSNMFGSLLSSSSSPSFGGSAANQTGAFDTIQAPPGGWKY